MSTTDIGDRIKTLREERRWSQGELARHSGLRQPFISKVEQGLKRPSADSIDRIAAALEVQPAQLVDGTECEGPYFTERLTSAELEARARRQEDERLEREARLLHLLAAYYERARRLFDAIHSGYFIHSDPVLERVYQRLAGIIVGLVDDLEPLIPEIRERVHVPETTDGDVRAGTVDADIRGVELEALWETIDQPAMARTALFLRQALSRNSACEVLDPTPLIERGLEPFDQLRQFDEWLDDFRRTKAAEDKRLIDRIVERGRRRDAAG